MKIEIYQDEELLKAILCYSSAPQAIAISEDMVDHLWLDSNEVCLISATGQNFKEILNDLAIESVAKDSHKRVIIQVRTSINYSLDVSELSHISNLIAQFPIDTALCWGLATSNGQENNITLLIAISKNEKP